MFIIILSRAHFHLSHESILDALINSHCPAIVLIFLKYLSSAKFTQKSLILKNSCVFTCILCYRKSKEEYDMEQERKRTEEVSILSF